MVFSSLHPAFYRVPWYYTQQMGFLETSSPSFPALWPISASSHLSLFPQPKMRVLHSCAVSLGSLRPFPPANQFLQGRFLQVFTCCLQPAQSVLLSALLTCPGLLANLPCPADRLQSGLLMSQLLSWDASKLTINEPSWGEGGDLQHVCPRKAVERETGRQHLKQIKLPAVPFSHLWMSQNTTELYSLVAIPKSCWQNLFAFFKLLF